MKKIFSILLVFMMLVGMAGCSSNQQSADSTASEGGKSSDWPSKPIQVIVPFAPGGDTDANARYFEKYLPEALGTDVVLVNVEGNGGAIGALQGKDAKADGYNVLFHSSAFLTNELSGAIDFGIEELELSAIVAENPGNIVVVNSSLGIKTMDELVAYTKEHPGELKMTSNTGATTHAMALQLKDAGVDATIVDSGSSAERISSLLGGHVDIIIQSYGSVKDYLETGEFVGLGLITEEDAEYIDYPTLASQGYDVAFPSYFFFAFPKGTDQEIVNKFGEALKKVTENKDYAEDIKKGYNQSPVFYDGEEALEKLNEAKESIVKYTDQFQGK